MAATFVIPLVSLITLIFGIVILIWPKVINYAIAIWLIFTGLVGILSSF